MTSTNQQINSDVKFSNAMRWGDFSKALVDFSFLAGVFRVSFSFGFIENGKSSNCGLLPDQPTTYHVLVQPQREVLLGAPAEYIRLMIQKQLFSG